MVRRPKGPTALERENASLRRRLDQMKIDHTAAINAKNKALEEARLGGVLFELGGTFPELRRLVSLLRRAHDAASPLQSPNGDGRGSGNPSPLDRAASVSHDRGRVEWINGKLVYLADGIEERIKERGKVDERGPQCWQPDCPTRAAFQAFDAEVCISCGTPFGRYKKPIDFTKMEVKKKRCWIRGCPMYNKTGQCAHA